LTRREEEVSLICLRYFRGDWELYLDYLNGPRVSGPQQLREVPVVERLKERDRHTDFLAALLEEEIILTVESLPFESLYPLWEQCLLLKPEADPFREFEGPREEPEDPTGEHPPSFH
jgi:hypothetical protein